MEDTLPALVASYPRTSVITTRELRTNGDVSRTKSVSYTDGQLSDLGIVTGHQLNSTILYPLAIYLVVALVSGCETEAGSVHVTNEYSLICGPLITPIIVVSQVSEVRTHLDSSQNEAFGKGQEDSTCVECIVQMSSNGNGDVGANLI